MKINICSQCQRSLKEYPSWHRQIDRHVVGTPKDQITDA